MYIIVEFGTVVINLKFISKSPTVLIQVKMRTHILGSENAV